VRSSLLLWAWHGIARRSTADLAAPAPALIFALCAAAYALTCHGTGQTAHGSPKPRPAQQGCPSVRRSACIRGAAPVRSLRCDRRSVGQERGRCQVGTAMGGHGYPMRHGTARQHGDTASDGRSGRHAWTAPMAQSGPKGSRFVRAPRVLYKVGHAQAGRGQQDGNLCGCDVHVVSARLLFRLIRRLGQEVPPVWPAAHTHQRTPYNLRLDARIIYNISSTSARRGQRGRPAPHRAQAHVRMLR
jgi:hypothetical protein